MSIYIVTYAGVMLGLFSSAQRAHDFVRYQPQGARMVVDVRTLDACN